MIYIFLAAGKGTRLHPLTLQHPKSLYRLDKDTSVLQRMVSLLKKYDALAKIVIVTGFMADMLQAEIDEVKFIHNPFYAVTNSIASLWFARDYLAANEDVTIINGDIVMEEKLISEVICKKVLKPTVLLDSSIKINGDYNVQVNGDKVLVMSKELNEYSGEYAGVAKLPPDSALDVKNEIEIMMKTEMYDQWYENALVQMIFQRNFELYYQDISSYHWTEVDNVGDFLLAKKIHQNSFGHKTIVK